MALTLAALLVPTALTFLVSPALARDNPEYCQQNPGDPRCNPEYCQFNPDDPWCWDPNYCERNPTDPICQKEPVEKKEKCHYTMTSLPPVLGAVPGPVVQAAPGAGPCGQSWTWVAARPDVRTVTAVMRNSVWKDLDCDGQPDDWNTTNPDGTCAIPNEYGPKTGNPSVSSTPKPDGHLDECDQQHYEWQWRSLN